jgi:hypothetical protein
MALNPTTHTGTRAVWVLVYLLPRLEPKARAQGGHSDLEGVGARQSRAEWLLQAAAPNKLRPHLSKCLYRSHGEKGQVVGDH